MSDDNSKTASAPVIDGGVNEAPTSKALKTVEAHALEFGTASWEFAAAKAAQGWAAGQEMTALDYRAAVENARKERVG